MYVPAGAPSIAYVPFASVTARKMVGAPVAFRSIACTVRPATGRPVSSATARPVKRPGDCAESAEASARHQETTFLGFVAIFITSSSGDVDLPWLELSAGDGAPRREDARIIVCASLARRPDMLFLRYKDA